MSLERPIGTLSPLLSRVALAGIDPSGFSPARCSAHDRLAEHEHASLMGRGVELKPAHPDIHEPLPLVERQRGMVTRIHREPQCCVPVRSRARSHLRRVVGPTPIRMNRSARRACDLGPSRRCSGHGTPKRQLRERDQGTVALPTTMARDASRGACEGPRGERVKHDADRCGVAPSIA